MKFLTLLLVFVRKYWPSILLLVLLLLSLLLMRGSASRLKQDNERLSVELAHAQIAPAIIHDTIRDTVPVSTAPVVVLEKASYKKDIADEQLLKDLNISTGQVVTQQKTATEYSDTVLLHRASPSAWRYADRWVSLTLTTKPPDTTLAYTVRDSVTTFVYREYKHRFLWWKWGTKGYKVKVVNFNPHATIRYNQFVRVE